MADSTAQPTASTPQQKIIDTCEAEFAAHIADCSGFAKAVGADLGVVLTGMANDIVDQIQAGSWRVLANGVEAMQEACAGRFVLGALKDEPHGHVVVVVNGPLDPSHQMYPTAYWGSIRGAAFAGRYKTVNWAWTVADRDRVTYASCSLGS
ncbi:MAG: hypothetical protein WCE75_14735 [Terracidiphilus sp.]